MIQFHVFVFDSQDCTDGYDVAVRIGKTPWYRPIAVFPARLQPGDKPEHTPFVAAREDAKAFAGSLEIAHLTD